MTDKAIIEVVEPVIQANDSYIRISVRYQIDGIGEWVVEERAKSANDINVIVAIIKTEMTRLVALRTSYTDVVKPAEGGYYDASGVFHAA